MTSNASSGLVGYRKLAERVVYDGYRRVVRRTFEGPAGQVDYDILDEGDTAVALVLAADRVVMLESYRFGPERRVLELPGGVLDGSESPRQAVEREVLEETGLRLERLQAVATTLHCPYWTRRVHVFVAHVASSLEQMPTAEQDAKICLLTLAELRQRLAGDAVLDVGPIYLALDHLGQLGASGP